MLIEIDFREKQLIEILKKHKMPHSSIVWESANLPVGDVCITRGDSLKLYVERKTLEDLSASIKDGRYSDQSCRLSEAATSPELVFYLIEGNWNKYSANQHQHQLPLTTLMSALFSISTNKKFSTHYTQSCEESIEWLICVADKFRRTQYNVAAAPVKVQAQRRSDIINPSNVEEIMLSQVPGISVGTAAAILEQCGGLANTLSIVRSDPSSLAKICLKDKNGKGRKLPKNVIAKLLHLLGNQNISANSKV
tara:strand:- start:6367 stop:7119 length:753 start_codon:yes stop_codon:yes gene_type:complete